MSSNYADQLRDAQFRKDVKGAGWNELHSLADTTRNQIAQMSFLLRDITADVDASGTRSPEFDILSNGTMRDLSSLASDFANLYAKHEHRTGKAQDGADYSEYFAIGMNYTELNEQIIQVIGNATFALTEHHHRAQEVLRARKAEQEAAQAASAPVETTAH